MPLPPDELRIVNRIELARDVLQRPEDMLRRMNGLVTENGCFTMLPQKPDLVRRVADENQAVARVVVAMRDRVLMQF